MNWRVQCCRDPAVKVPDNTSSVTLFASKVMSFVAPRSGVVQLDAGTVSKDPAVVDAYVNDPLVYTGKITARFGAGMLATMQRVTDQRLKLDCHC